MTITRTLVFISAMLPLCCGHLLAQRHGISYTTEMQTDFRGGSNWVNLLRIDFSYPLADGLALELASISIAKTRESRLVNDMLTFSNIEEDNLVFAPAVFGLSFRFGDSRLFAGVRNVNEDYFTSEWTSLFTNSSCGIFPTVSVNYPIANYPRASMGLHYSMESGAWNLMSSLYNGTAYQGFAGRDNVFRLCPAEDGLFSMTSISYESNGSGYYCGFALYYGKSPACEGAYEKASPEKEKKALSGVLWGYAEQRLTRSVSLLLQYSVSPGIKYGCRNYAAAGIVTNLGKSRAGAVLTFGDFGKATEADLELTWKFRFPGNGWLQPSVHFITNGGRRYFIGILRFAYEI